MSQTLRDLTGAPSTPAPLSESALVMIDCQNTYREGVMKLEGVEEALVEATALLQRARQAKRPIFHIRHDAGEGTPYDLTQSCGQISDCVAPQEGEAVITKNLPSAFENTNLHELLQATGVRHLVLAGFMTHVCVNSTARAGFNRGYGVSVVANATATRALHDPQHPEQTLSASQMHAAALAALADMFAVVVPTSQEVPE